MTLNEYVDIFYCKVVKSYQKQNGKERHLFNNWCSIWLRTFFHVSFYAVLTGENADLSRQLEDAEAQLSQLQKLKTSLSAQLVEAKRTADEEAREKQSVLSKLRNLEHDYEHLREGLDEEQEAKAELQRQITKANNDAQQWRAKYEGEGLSRADDLEEAKRKLLAKLQDAEEHVESANAKVSSLEKVKQRLQGELEDLAVEVERVWTLLTSHCSNCVTKTDAIKIWKTIFIRKNSPMWTYP